jgi:hypothetical protein
MKPEDDWIPERTLWQRLPRKTLFKGFWLLMMLVAVFWFQSKSQSCATTFTQGIVPTPPRSAERSGDKGRTVQFAAGSLPPAKTQPDAGAVSPAGAP